jgi:CSLREA domain-containing protein
MNITGISKPKSIFFQLRIASPKKSLFCIVIVVCLLALMGINQAFLGSAAAASFVVDTLDDELNSDGDCSLREAITAANSNAASDACPAGSSGSADAITFEVTGTIILTAQLPNILPAGNLIIDGGSNITISGNGNVRGFYVNNGANLTLRNITISDGHVTCCGTIGQPLNGGSLYNQGTTTITSSTFINSSAEGSGGAIYNDFGALYITNSKFSGNKSDYGGAVSGNHGSLSIDKSTFYNNRNLTTSSGYGGAISSGSTLEIKNSTFYSNTTIYNGGALWVTLDSNATIINSTFSGNKAEGFYGQGGAIASSNNSNVTVINTTLYNNHAVVTGSAISKNTGIVTLRNTIVANSLSVGNCSGAITDGSHNIDSSATCGFDPVNGSMSNTDPKLGPLADNGGSAFTHVLLEGSPAINKAAPTYCPITDQRSINRRVGYCDIGAYEAQPTSLVALAGSGQSTTINSPFPLPIQVLVQDNYQNDLGGLVITFSGPTAGIGISNSGITVTTGINGIASFTPIANDLAGGPYIVTAHVDTLMAEYYLTNLPILTKAFLPLIIK